MSKLFFSVDHGIDNREEIICLDEVTYITNWSEYRSETWTHHYTFHFKNRTIVKVDMSDHGRDEINELFSKLKKPTITKYEQLQNAKDR